MPATSLPFGLSLLPLCLLESILHTTDIKQQMFHIKSLHAILLTTFFSTRLLQTRNHNSTPISLAWTLLFPPHSSWDPFLDCARDSPTS